MPTISASIMTKNEAHDIAACIESVLFMDEIIVLDSGSTDGTQDICRKYPKVKLIETDWPGFGEQSNRCIEYANSEWCLLLDADERVTENLKNEITKVLQNPADYVAYKTPRLNFFSDRAMVHCLSPKGDQPTRLIKKGFAHYENIIHPKVTISGKVGVLQNYLLHYPLANLEEMIYKTNSYSSISAEKLFSENVKSGIAKTLIHSFWTFFKFYFLKGGCLDGWPGFLLAIGNAEGTFYRYAKLMEKIQKAAPRTPIAPSGSPPTI